MDTDALIEFLRARLDEDEQLARAANDGPWQARKITGPTIGTDEAEVIHVSDVPDRGFYRLGMDRIDGPHARHIERHQPARVLREVEAKRRILAKVVPQIDAMDAQIESEWGSGGYEATGESELLLKLLALPYANHPDYRPEWRP